MPGLQILGSKNSYENNSAVLKMYEQKVIVLTKIRPYGSFEKKNQSFLEDTLQI